LFLTDPKAFYSGIKEISFYKSVDTTSGSIFIGFGLYYRQANLKCSKTIYFSAWLFD